MPAILEMIVMIVIRIRRCRKRNSRKFNKNAFKFFQYYSDSDREIMHMFKFIVTELYCKYYNREEDWKLYQINNLLINFLIKK